MTPHQIPRKLAGAVVAAAGALAGVWLMIAPFALDTQPETGGWSDATTTEFFTGLAVLLAGLLGLVGFTAAIRHELIGRGALPRRTAAHRQPVEPPELARPEPEPGHDLSGLLVPLIKALEEDLTQRPALTTAAHHTDDIQENR